MQHGDLKFAPRIVQVLDFFLGDIRHLKSTCPFLSHQPIINQEEQRFTDRSPADAELLRESEIRKRRTRCVTVGPDAIQHLPVCITHQGIRHQLFSFHPVYTSCTRSVPAPPPYCIQPIFRVGCVRGVVNDFVLFQIIFVYTKETSFLISVFAHLLRPIEYSQTFWLGDGVCFHLQLHQTDHGFVLGEA